MSKIQFSGGGELHVKVNMHEAVYKRHIKDGYGMMHTQVGKPFLGGIEGQMEGVKGGYF